MIWPGFGTSWMTKVCQLWLYCVLTGRGDRKCPQGQGHNMWYTVNASVWQKQQANKSKVRTKRANAQTLSSVSKRVAVVQSDARQIYLALLTQIRLFTFLCYCFQVSNPLLYPDEQWHITISVVRKHCSSSAHNGWERFLKWIRRT